jgi:hypothetical protein
MNQYGNNWVIGASIANHEINSRSQYNRGGTVHIKFYYCKLSQHNHDTVFGEVAQTHCKTEYGILASKLLLKKCRKINNNRMATKEELVYVMKKGE